MTPTIQRIKPWELLHKALPHSQLSDFRFNVPMEIVKSRTIKEGQRPIRGVASTPHKDLQNEEVIQKGLELSYFLKHGYYNDDHQKGHQHKVGQPTVAMIKSCKDRYDKGTTGLWTEGFLWKKGLHAGADAIWELAQAMGGSNSDRQMGFSIEGKVLQRDGQRIIKAWVQDIAITASPINTYSWLELVNDLGKSVWANERDVRDLQKSVSSMDSFVKSMLLDASGWEGISKSEREGEEQLKAMAAASNPLVPQSLENHMKVTQYSAGGCPPADKDEDETDVSKALQVCYYHARTRGWSPTQARALALASVTRTILM